MRRAWIEIIRKDKASTQLIGSLSVRRAWIEIAEEGRVSAEQGSLSVRRAWIEILQGRGDCPAQVVALREESVD